MTPNLLLALIARPSLHKYALVRFRRLRDLMSPDEICSAADEALVLACRRYDPTKGAFGRYARYWVRRQMYRAFAQELKWQRSRVGEGEESFHVAMERDAARAIDEVMDAVTAREVFGKLEPDVGELWRRYVGGRSIRDLARERRVSIRQIRETLAEPRRHFGPPPDDSPADSARQATNGEEQRRSRPRRRSRALVGRS